MIDWLHNIAAALALLALAMKSRILIIILTHPKN